MFKRIRHERKRKVHEEDEEVDEEKGRGLYFLLHTVRLVRDANPFCATLFGRWSIFVFFGFVSLVSFRSCPEKRFGERRGVEQNALRDRILPFIGISVDAQINRQNVAGINSRVF